MPGKIECPRFEKLEAEFIQGGGEWKEVEIQELFDGKVGSFDIQKAHINGRGKVVVSSGVTNRGIIGYTDVEAEIIPENTITVDMFGNVFARDHAYKLVTHARVFALLPKTKMNIRTLNYVVTQMSYLSKIYGYEFMATWDKIKEKKIILPYINDKPAYSFMEKYIEEIERGVFEKIDAYLEENELKLCRLTAAEKNAFEMFDEGASIEWKRVRIGDVFEIKTPKAKFNAMSLSFEGEYPYIARGGGNNGIKGYITEDEKYLNDGNTISFGQDTSTMFYQQAPYFTGDKIKILKPKDFILNKYIALYYIASAKKKLKTFKWGSTSFKVENLENIELEIPIYKSLPNHQFMKNFIRAIEKLIMRNMVMYLNEKIKIASESQKKI